MEGTIKLGKILSGYLMPHPPILIPDVGKGQEQRIINTVHALNKIGEEIANIKPHTIILISPHGALFKDAISIMGIQNLKGDLRGFGATDITIEKENNLELANKLENEAWEQGIPTILLDKETINDYKINTALDHGAIVPLHFVEKVYSPYQLVHINYGLIPRQQLYHFGRIIAETIENSENDAVIIASGDLSHKLTQDAPAGYHSSGHQFDETIITLLEKGDIKGIFALEESWVSEAGECGLRSIDIMLGAFDGWRTSTEILSYEGPFGVGYGTAVIYPIEKVAERIFLNQMKNIEKEKIRVIREKEDTFVRLARTALETYVIHNKKAELPKNIQKEFITKQTGAFVSIKKDGQLRGCMGTIEPTETNIGEEIIKNAINAGTHDPRFYPVDKSELGQLVYSVDILGKPELINNIAQLDVKKYGIIVEKGLRRGLLLPDLEGINTTEEQLDIVLKKANIKKNEKYKMFRFKVERYR